MNNCRLLLANRLPHYLLHGPSITPQGRNWEPACSPPSRVVAASIYLMCILLVSRANNETYAIALAMLSLALLSFQGAFAFSTGTAGAAARPTMRSDEFRRLLRTVVYGAVAGAVCTTGNPALLFQLWRGSPTMAHALSILVCLTLLGVSVGSAYAELLAIVIHSIRTREPL